MSEAQGDDDDRELADRILRTVPGTAQPKPLDAPSTRRKQARADEARQSVGLQKALAIFAMVAMGVQILLADAGFALYGIFNGWHIPPAAIIAWLSATVIEVIGLVLVITQRLFPTRRPAK